MMIYQGTTQPLSLDLSGKGTIESIEFKVFKVEPNSKSLVSKYKYPEEEGFEVVVKDADIYTMTLSATTTADMLGVYGVEVTYTVASKPFRVQAVGITVLAKVV